jgi:hypothetical protein
MKSYCRGGIRFPFSGCVQLLLYNRKKINILKIRIINADFHFLRYNEEKGFATAETPIYQSEKSKKGADGC